MEVRTGPRHPSGERRVAQAAALLTLWLDAEGRWHASVVLPDGERLEFLSPFELARWSRRVPVRPLPVGTGLR